MRTSAAHLLGEEIVRQNTRPAVWLALLAIVALLVGCTSTQADPLPTVHLHNLQPLPTPRQEIVPLRVSVAAMISPKGTVESYRPLLDYLAQELGRPVELVQRRTYAEVNDLIRRNQVDVAFICTRAYVVGRREFGMQLLAIPEVRGKDVYFSEIIVHREYPAQRMDDLRGSTFAFTDPLSNTGYLYPVYLLHTMGEEPNTFFARTFFTYSHDNAIYAVAEGVADAAAVDSLVLQYALERDPELKTRIRVIHRSPPFGMPPVVVGPDIRPQLKVTLQEILFSMDDDPEGRRALEALGVDRFIAADDEAYDFIRYMEETLGIASDQ